MATVNLNAVRAALVATALLGTSAFAGLDSAAAAQSRNQYSSDLTGTYQLDRSRSDNPQRVADQALRQVPVNERSRVSREIADRLEPPDEIAIDRVGDEVSLASSRAPRTTFDADGRSRSERGIRGRNTTTRASLYGDRLEVTTTGDSETDFSATFEPIQRGNALRVTRRLTSPSLRQPVVVQSVYRKTSETPIWDIYDRSYQGESGRRSNDDIVPTNTTLIATLDDPIDVQTARINDRVTVTVRDAPTSDLESAVIEGYVTSSPSADSSRGLAIDFNRIRLRNGRTVNFSGIVENVRGPNGESIPFNGEEVKPDNDSQREEAIQRGAIGAAVGAIIGAVAGGAKGAAIGAVVGGGGGAATVLIGDQNQGNLPRGTEFTIRTD